MELVFSARNILGGKKIPVGSAVLLSSLSSLGTVGTAKYILDMAVAIKTLEDDYSGRVKVLHGIPIPRFNLADPLLVRSLSDVLDWLHETDPRNSYHLTESNNKFREIFLTGGNANPLATIRIPLSLPATIRRRDLACFTACGRPDLAMAVAPPTSEKEAEMINCLFEEINRELRCLAIDEPRADR